MASVPALLRERFGGLGRTFWALQAGLFVNRAGQFVTPSVESTTAAAAGAPFALGGLLAGAWLLLALGMRVPATLDQRRYALPDLPPDAARGLMRRIAGVPGVREVLLTGEGVACLKVDRQGFDEQNVIKLIAGEK